MWARLAFCFLVIAAAGAELRAWQEGKHYDYQIHGRTLAALHDVADQYNGVLFQAKLHVQPESARMLNARITHAQQAEIEKHLPAGWGSPIDESALEWKPLKLTDEPFQIVIHDGVVRRLIVSSKVPTSEVNFIKGIVSQLQVDTKGANMEWRKEEDLPTEQNPSGVYNVMEDTVTGSCQVQYDVSELPRFILQSRPEIAPMPELVQDGHFIDIVKTSNYSRCVSRPEYHFGLNGLHKWKPATSKMGQFFARSSVSRVVISGNVNKYTIQSSVTTHKAIMSPALYNPQKGMVVSRMNMTLAQIKNAEGAVKPPSSPVQHKDLVYRYDNEIVRGAEPMSRTTRDAPENSEQESSSVEVASAKDFRQDLKKPCANDNDQSGYACNSDDASFEQGAYLPEDMDQSIDVLLHPNYAFPEAMEKQKVYSYIVEVAKQIGRELQSAKAIQSKATLAKFNILVTLVRSARTLELKRISRELYTKESQEQNPADVAAWNAFRDAVAEAGTAPALLTLKDWIQNDIVKGQEAAELIATLPRSARWPNKKYVQTFFELATSQKVKHQQRLNTTAVLAFSELVRLAQVDKQSMHNRYPVHVFGRLNPQESQALARDYIPYFKYALKKAVLNGDSRRIQTFTRVLGNFAHPKIVEVFEPYLSGRILVTKFQRAAMVIALNNLAETNPRITRAALLKVYQNVAEAAQVRTAAVLFLMKTNPSAALLQRMAESAKDEHNPHIRAVVHSAIEAAARLNAWDNWELKTHAMAAQDMLNKTEVNAHLSQVQIKSNDVEGTPSLSYSATFSTIGSQDSLAPQGVFMKLRQNLADLKLNSEGFGTMVSSVEELINSITNQMDVSKAWTMKSASPFKSSHGWNIEDVLSELNIVRDQAEPVEGNLNIQSHSEKRFYAFDNQTIENLPSALQKIAEELRHGKNFNYTKLYNQYTMSMSFPTATGFPFYFSLAAPTLLSVGGKARVVMHPQPLADKITVPETINGTLDIHVIASSKVQAELGFVNTLTLERYTAGLDKDMQIHVPVHAQVDVEIKDKKDEQSGKFVEVRSKVHPTENEENFQIASMSSRPYLAKQRLVFPEPLDQHIIHVRKPFQANFTLGQDLTGMAIRVDASTEMKFVDFASLYKDAKKHDLISALTFLNKDESIHNYELNLSFDHEKSSAKAVELTAAFETSTKKTFDERDTYARETKPEEEIKQFDVKILRTTMMAHSDDEAVTEHTVDNTKASLSKRPSHNPANPTDKTPNSQGRRTEFLKKSAKWIDDADSVVVDLSAVFKGKSQAEFIATAAIAKSQVSDESRALLFLRKKSADQKEQQLVMTTTADIPRVPLANFVNALKSQPDIYVRTAIAFGEEIDSNASQVDAVALLRRSKSQREHVRRSPMGKLCIEEMHKGNNYLPACRNATLTASMLNNYYVDITYDRIPESIQNATYKAYSLARDFGWEFNSESVIGVQNQNRHIALKARFEPEYQAVNVSINAPNFNSKFDNVRLNRWVAAAVVAHPTFNPARMLALEAFQKEFFPTCTVGKTAVNTFSNKTYPINTGKNWHAVLVSAYKKNSASEKFQSLVVLTRETSSSEHQKEVIIMSGPNVIEMTYARDYARVNVNGKTIRISEYHTNSFSDGQQNTWAMLYGRPDGSVKVELPVHDVKMLYDRHNLVIKGGNQLRDQMRGLCGIFNDEDASDFTVPRNCIVKDAKDFAASYIVKPSGNAVEEQKQAKEAKCIPKKYDFGSQRVSSEESFEEHESTQSSGCVSFKVQVVERDGMTCFSKRPQASCNSHCRPTSETELKIDFHCLPNAKAEVAEQWKKQLKSGSIPSQLSRSASTKKLSVKIPETCQA